MPRLEGEALAEPEQALAEAKGNLERFKKEAAKAVIIQKAAVKPTSQTDWKSSREESLVTEPQACPCKMTSRRSTLRRQPLRLGVHLHKNAQTPSGRCYHVAST